MKKISLFTIAILIVFCLLSCDQQQEHEHVWGDEVITRAATCLEDGEAVLRCSCGETKTVVIEKLGHDIEEVVTEPTYLKKGRIDYNCSRCDVTELRESVELERRSLEGYGFSIHDHYFDAYYGKECISFTEVTFLADNQLEYTWSGYPISMGEEDPYEIYKYYADYIIREKEDSEGNIVSYFTFYDCFEVPIREEEDGRLFVTWSVADSRYVEDFELTKDHHIHSSEDVTNFVSDDDIIDGVEHNVYDDCQMFTCDECVIDGRKVVVYTEHLRGVDGKCIHCGATVV